MKSHNGEKSNKCNEGNPPHTSVTTVDSRGTLQENAHLKDQNSFATIVEAKGTLPETVISEQSGLIIVMNIEKYVQVIWVSPSSGLSLAI